MQRNRRDIELNGRQIGWKIGKRINKCDISASKVAAKNRTITMISFLSCGITKKDTFSRTRINLLP
jgi:hypothetical protein